MGESSNIMDFCGYRDVSKVLVWSLHELWPVSESKVVSWGPYCFQGVDVNLCYYWEVIGFDQTSCVLGVTFDDGVHDIFCAKDVVHSGVVACVMSSEGQGEWWQRHFHVLST